MGKNLINIMDYISNELGAEYIGKGEVVQFADYGVPQRRERLITVFTRTTFGKKIFGDFHTLLPPTTHSDKPGHNLLKWITIRDVLSDIPPLDGVNKKSATSDTIKFHKVPVLDEKKYYWVSNTPPEQGAFDNQCVNDACGFQGNPVHGNKKDVNGINRSSKETPIFCQQCGQLLPRPTTQTKSVISD